MNGAGWRRFLRVTLAGGLAGGVGLLLGGCVYLRLLEMRRQLADFDRYFAVQESSGLRLSCQQPVLLAQDFHFLGLHPALVQRTGTAEKWQIRWTKQPAPEAREKATFEITFDLYFSEGKFTALHVSEDYFAFVPKPVLLAALRSFGAAKVDRERRRIEGNVSTLAQQRITPPTEAAVRELLGAPTVLTVGGDRNSLRYHFVSADPGAQGRDFDLSLVFAASSGRLLETTGRLPVGSIHLKFDAADSGIQL